MPVPTFDESTKAEKLSVEVFRWLKEAAMYTRTTPNSADEVYDTLKLLLRLVAVRNPECQSHATREALGSLIEAICAQPSSDQIVHDLLGLLIRIVDAKQNHRYNPMKHLAISGLGYLSRYLVVHMRQMAANVFIICLDSLTVCPMQADTRLYRNTLLWTMQQAATTTVDEPSVKVAFRFAKGIIETAQNNDADREAVARAFNLLAALLPLPATKAIERKFDSFHTLFLTYGISQSRPEITEAAANFYCAAITSLSPNTIRTDLTNIVDTILKLQSSRRQGVDQAATFRLHGYIILLKKILNHETSLKLFESELEEWLAPLVLQLSPALSKQLLVHGILERKLDGRHAGVDIVAVFLRQLALSRAQPSAKQAAKLKSAKAPKPLTESCLACLTDTITMLGSFMQPSADSVHQATLGLICNSNDTLTEEQLGWAVLCLVEIVRSSPPLLITTIESCLKQLELATASSKGVQIAYVVGTMVAESRSFAFYGDIDLNSRVVLLGIDNIKRRENIASYKVGWAMLFGALRLGPDAVKPLVAHLLVLWETHLSKEAAQYPEFAERSLTGLLVFIVHNKSLLTADVTARLGKILYTFWSTIENTQASHSLRRRLLQCYRELLELGRLDNYPSSLLMKYIAHISVSENYTKENGVVIESAIATPLKQKSVKEPLNKLSFASDLLLQSSNAVEFGIASADVDKRAALANDVDFVLHCYTDYTVKDKWMDELPRDLYTEIIDLAVDVTSRLLPLQPIRIQESVFDALLANLEDSAGSQSLRQVAVAYNIAKFIKSTMRRDFPVDTRVVSVIVSAIKMLLQNPAEEIREMAADSFGALAVKFKASPKTSETLSSVIKELLEFSASGRTGLELRMGSVTALGRIAQAWSYYDLLDAIFKLFMQLAAVSNPGLHLSAISSMVTILVTPGFIDQKYVKCTLKTLTLTYLLESHNNSKVFQRMVAEGLAQVVSRIGPMLATEQQTSNRSLIICLADQLQHNDEAQVRVLAWKCYIELYYYARQGIAWALLIKRWRDIIITHTSPDSEIDAAINGLLILMKISARTIVSIAGPGFEDALWLLLDKHPDHHELQLLFRTWMDQTLDTDLDTTKWIRRLGAVVMKPRYFFMNRMNSALKKPSGEEAPVQLEKKASVTPTAVAADEDVALEVRSDEGSNEQFSWQARRFTLDLLLHLLELDLDGKDDQAKAESTSARLIGDVIKISFSSSTSQVLGLQYSGLALLNKIMRQLSQLSDPDFPQISLLAQYQVQIISALAPAFRSESAPGLALAALNACSSFVTSDIVNSKEKLSRLVKVLEDSLASMDGDAFKLGTLNASADASRVLRVAVLAVWAQIYNHAQLKPHLKAIIEPHEEKLIGLWTSTIYEYARMRSSVELQWSLSSFTAAVDQMKEVQTWASMKPIHNSTWLSFVRALSRSEDLDGKLRSVLCGLCFQTLHHVLQVSNVPSSAQGPGDVQLAAAPHDEHSSKEASMASVLQLNNLSNPLQHDAFFVVNGSTPSSRHAVLTVLHSLLTPSMCEELMSSANDYIEEMVTILYRAMLVGTPEEQVAILNIAHSLVKGQPETDDSVDHFFELLKVAILPLRKMFPELFERPQRDSADETSTSAPAEAEEHNEPKTTATPLPTVAHKSLDSQQISLLHRTMDTMIDIAQVFREVIQNDLWVCLLQVFEELNHREPVVVAPSFKRLLEILASQVEVRGITFVVGALTVSLKRAVNRKSTAEALLISAAITCTNSRSLYGPLALSHIQRFGQRAADALIEGIQKDATEEQKSVAVTAIQCISAVFRTSSDAPTGAAFAYACLPALVQVVTDPSLSETEFGEDMLKQSVTALTVYAAMDGTLEALTLVVPTLIAAQDTASRSALLLQLMKKNPTIFKQCVWKLDLDDRSALQSLLARPIEEEQSSSTISEEDSEDEGEEISLTSFV